MADGVGAGEGHRIALFEVTLEAREREDLAGHLGLDLEDADQRARSDRALAQVEAVLANVIGFSASVEGAPRKGERLRLLDCTVAAARGLESALRDLNEVTLSNPESEIGQEGGLVDESSTTAATFAQSLSKLARATTTREGILDFPSVPLRHPEEGRDEAIAQLAEVFRETTGTPDGSWPPSMLDFVHDTLVAAALRCPEHQDMLRRLLRQIEGRKP